MDDKDIKQDELDSLEVDTQIEDTPPPESEPIEPVPVAPKKSKKKLILIITLIVVLLAAAGVAAYFLFFQPKVSDTTAEDTPSTAQTATPQDTTDYAKDLIEKVRAAEIALQSTYPNSKVEDQPDAVGPGYTYGTDEYSVTGEIGYTIVVSNTGDANPSGPFITDISTAASSTLFDEKTLTKSDDETVTLFQNENVICSVPKDSYPLYVSCANIRDYKQISEDVAPFAKAYFLAQDNPDKSSSGFHEPRIAKKSDGYASAVVSMGVGGVGGFAGLFYSKDGNWIFWQGTQSAIDCAEYNTHALQKSFEGETCWDESTQGEAKVQVTI